MKIFSIILFAGFLSGCWMVHSAFFEKDYTLNYHRKISIGYSLLSWTRGYKDGYGRISGGIRSELIYNGIEGSTIYLKYREYSLTELGNFAREAFYLDLRYDISTSNYITFRDVKILIDSANQEMISYAVIQGPMEAEVTESGRIGIQFDENGRITEVIRNGPAYKAGIEEDDYIVAIDSIPFVQGNYRENLKRIIGEPGTEIVLEIERNGKKKIFTMRRKKF